MFINISFLWNSYNNVPFDLRKWMDTHYTAIKELLNLQISGHEFLFIMPAKQHKFTQLTSVRPSGYDSPWQILDHIYLHNCQFCRTINNGPSIILHLNVFKVIFNSLLCAFEKPEVTACCIGWKIIPFPFFQPFSYSDSCNFFLYTPKPKAIKDVHT